MTSIDRTAYPRLKRNFTTQELKKIYTVTVEEKSLAKKSTKTEINRLIFLLLLKTFQRLGYFINLKKIPESIINYLALSLGLPLKLKLSISEATLYKYHGIIRDYLKVKSYSKEGNRLMLESVYKITQIKDNPADLINVAIEELIHHRYELPAFSTINRSVIKIRNLVNNGFFKQINSQLNEDIIEILDNLLVVDEITLRSEYNRLKELPKRPSLSHLKALLKQLNWLQSLVKVEEILKDIPPQKLEHWALEAKALNVAEIKEFNSPKRYTLILALINYSLKQTKDNLANMFLKRISTIHKRGKAELERLHLLQREKTENLVFAFTDVLRFLKEEDINANDDVKIESNNQLKNPPKSESNNNNKSSSNQVQNIQKLLSSPENIDNLPLTINDIIKIIQDYGTIEQLLEDCEDVSSYSGNNYLPLLWKFYRSHRSTLFGIIKSLQLESTTADNSLISAINYLLTIENSRKEWIESSLDLSFISELWQRTILTIHNNQNVYIRRHFEVCIFSYLASELKSGDIAIKGSGEFADYRQQLLSWEECEPMVTEYCAELGFANNSKDFVEDLKIWLELTATEVDQGYPSNGMVVINENGEPILKKLVGKGQTSSALVLENMIKSKMPERNLIDILYHVNCWLNWTRYFSPLSGSDAKIENKQQRYLLTTFAYGCNLGATQGAKHFRGLVTPKMLSFIHRRHISLNHLNSALEDVINSYHKLTLPKLWGDSKIAAVDGTKFDLYENNLFAEYHIRYGGYGGIAYHHVSDHYIALFSHFIPCGVWEAIYIIEGLLKNKSDIQPDTIHGDTQAQSTPVFALSYLLGIKLMPRIRNWKDLKFFRPSKDTKYKHIDSLFKDTINWQLIQTHYQDLLRVVLSIKAGKISSSMLLRKLGNYSRKNRLYQAFRELGRVVRTVFLLQYISSVELRHQILNATNKVEAYHGFAKWLFFGGEGIIATNEPETQEKMIKYNQLIANLVIFHNVVDLTGVLKQLRKEGYPLNRADVASLSPYLTAHIKRFGDYWVDWEQIPDALDFHYELVFND